mmetsp:Transcript_18726/g.21184  ORF Transcript_18726/g.21184 Transcript_18726/m.21184 type:complete len:88 (+) Transcript_18726:114-377(+)
MLDPTYSYDPTNALDSSHTFLALSKKDDGTFCIGEPAGFWTTSRIVKIADTCEETEKWILEKDTETGKLLSCAGPASQLSGHYASVT